jgi:hypothetical protein
LLAAGVPLEEQGKLTAEESHYHLEAFRERTYWQTRPLMSQLLQNVDEKGVDKILAGTPGDPKRSQVMDILMAAYTPWWRQAATGARRATPVPDMTTRAAEGLVRAAEAGLIPHADWLQLVGVWERVVVTAGTG